MNVVDVVARETLRQQRRSAITMRHDDTIDSIVTRVSAALRAPAGVVFIHVSAATGWNGAELLAEDFDVAFPPQAHEPPSAFVQIKAADSTRVQRLCVAAQLARADTLLIVMSDRVKLPDVVETLPDRHSTLFDKLSHHRVAQL